MQYRNPLCNACSFGKFRGDSSVASWLCGIARNVYYSTMRQPQTLPLEEAEHLQMSKPESEVRGVPLEDVMQLVDGLPEGYGQVFQ